jgi:hypothetical protein
MKLPEFWRRLEEVCLRIPLLWRNILADDIRKNYCLLCCISKLVDIYDTNVRQLTDLYENEKFEEQNTKISFCV